MRARKWILGCTSHALAMQAHPDMNRALDTTREAVRLNEAYGSAAAGQRAPAHESLHVPPGSCLLSVCLR